jgi:uncharacterized phiE125 gp8 family phage protein
VIVRVKVIEPPTPEVEPLTIEECRAHLEAQRYDDSDSDVDAIDDAMILAWASAAREHCENFLGLSLAPQILEAALDEFPSTRVDGTTAIELPRGPVREIVSVIGGELSSEGSAGSESDGTFILMPTDYILDDYSVPAAGWPAASGVNAVKIRYWAGYGVDSDGGTALPWAIRAAMLLILGHLFANREDSTEKALTSIPNGAEALMRPLRVRLGMA